MREPLSSSFRPSRDSGESRKPYPRAVVMDSGLAPSARPGMTARLYAVVQPEVPRPNRLERASSGYGDDHRRRRRDWLITTLATSITVLTAAIAILVAAAAAVVITIT